MGELYNTFIERLDTLYIQTNFRKNMAKTQFIKLSQVDKMAYLNEKIGISKNTSDGWFRSKKKTVPRADNLLLIAKHFHVSVDYLLGNADSADDYSEQYIHNYIGLSNEAIRGLRFLYFPINHDVLDSVQVSRYDIIALNLILEDFYNKMMKTQNYKKFGEETDTLLNRIGQYIDSGSGAIEVYQNGKLDLYPSNEIVQSICRDKITFLLKELDNKYCLEIISHREANKKRFQNLYEDSVKEFLVKNSMPTVSLRKGSD